MSDEIRNDNITTDEDLKSVTREFKKIKDILADTEHADIPFGWTKDGEIQKLNQGR